MPDYALARRNMVDNQLRPSRIDDPRLLEAMGEVPRELFVPAALRAAAYGDDGLDLGARRHLIEPLALAKLLQVATVQPTDVVLVLGCDTGYCAAVLARLAATVFLLLPEGSETEAIDGLLSELGCDNVVIQTGELAAGRPDQAPFDLVVIAGAVSRVPDRLVEQLGEGGRLVTVVRDGRAGKVTLVRRVGGAIGRLTPFDAAVPELAALRPPPAFSFD